MYKDIVREFEKFADTPKTIVEIQQKFGKRKMEKVLALMKGFIITGKLVVTNDGRYVLV